MEIGEVLRFFKMSQYFDQITTLLTFLWTTFVLVLLLSTLGGVRFLQLSEMSALLIRLKPSDSILKAINIKFHQLSNQ